MHRTTRIRATPSLLQWAVLGVVVLVLYEIWLQYSLISSRGPYPLFYDERFLSKPALRMLLKHDFRPGFYRYGSIPIYLTRQLMALSIWWFRQQHSIGGIEDISSIGFPFYAPQQVVMAVRFGYSMLGVVSVVMTGIAATLAYRSRSVLFFAPVALMSSRWHLQQSWAYLNVDIAAALLSIIGLAYLAYAHELKTPAHRIYIPAIICGAVMATKYNSALIVLPFALACVEIHAPLRSFLRMLMLTSMSFVCFVLFQPYSVLDRKRFFADVAFEMHHYASGHLGHEAAPGYSQLKFYLGELSSDYGVLLSCAGLIGIVAGLIRARRITLLYLAFAGSVLVLMCSHRVHFTRSILPLFVLFSVFIGYGLSVFTESLNRWIVYVEGSVFRAKGRPVVARAIAGMCTCLVVIVGSPLARNQSPMQISTDSRLALAEWLHSSVEANCSIFSPVQLALSPETLPARCQTIYVSDPEAELRMRIAEETSPNRRVFVVVPTFGHDARKPDGAADAQNWRTKFEVASMGAALRFRAGRNLVLVNYPTIERGDPELSLYEILPR